MNIDKDTLHSIFNFMSKLVVLTAPGLMINEFVFHKGFYSGGILNLIDLFLLFIWSAAYSLPYYTCIILNISWHEIPSAQELEDAYNDPTIFESAIPLLFFLMIVNYVGFKIMLSMNWLTNLNNLGISQIHALLVISVIITCVVSFLIGKPYFFLTGKLVQKVAIAIHLRQSRKSGNVTQNST